MWYSNLNPVSLKLVANKDLAKDKGKVAIIKDLRDSVKEMKSWLDKQDTLTTKINEVKKARLELAKKEKSVQSDLNDFYAGVNDYFRDANNLSDRLKKISPDTPKKEFALAATNLSGLAIEKVKAELYLPKP
jgi:chromosome segregation ATPase